MTVDELLRLYPVSARWQRVLLERLDAAAVIYRLAATISNIAHPIRFRWYRAMPMDAAIVPGRRANRRRRQAGTHLRQDELLQAALEAQGGCAPPQRRPHPRARTRCG